MLATSQLKATLNKLPEPLRKQAQKVTIIFERIPNTELQADGIEADTLGLFIGTEFADEVNSVLPPQIILFLDNIWDFAASNETAYCEEVGITFLHELGHFLGLDEDDMTERGLE